MLAYVLAIAIAVGSLTFYLVAFFLPEVHRRQDFVWSGVGLFYALVLWFCAGRLTGAVLLGQIASGALVLWLGWQTLALRWALTPPSVRTPTSWPQVQQRWQAVQTQVSGYIKGRSPLSAIAAVVSDGQRGWDHLRQRIAGPRGQTAGDRTPLSQSPGTFVATPTQPASEPPFAPETAPPPPPATPGPLALPLTPGIKQVMILKDWVGDVWKEFNQPKPTRTLIDIPPRPPTVGKETATASAPAVATQWPTAEPSPEPEETPGNAPDPTPAPPPEGGETRRVPLLDRVDVEEDEGAISPPLAPSPAAAAADRAATRPAPEPTNWVDDDLPPPPSDAATTPPEHAEGAAAAVPSTEVAPSRWLDEEDRSWVDEEPLTPPTLETVAPPAGPIAMDPEDMAVDNGVTSEPDRVEPMDEARAKISPSPSDAATSNWTEDEANWPD